MTHLRHYFPEHEQKLLQIVIGRWKAEADDVHDEVLVDLLSRLYHQYELLQRLGLDLRVTYKRSSQWRLSWKF